MGNSSSGIIEAPSLKTLTINLGNRQKGRIQSKSVFNCKINTLQIRKIINKLLKSKISIKNNFFFNPYYKKNTSKLILQSLEKINFEKLIQKSFFNIK